MTSFTQLFAIRGASSILVPFAAQVAQSPAAGSGSDVYTSYSAHWNGLAATLGRTPTIYNTLVNGISTDPSAWVTNAQSVVNSLAASGMAANTVPLLSFAPQDSTGAAIYTQIAAGASTVYSGQTVDFWIQQMLGVFKTAGILKFFIRMGWSWNAGQNGWGIDQSMLTTFIAAHQHFATVCYSYALANGMSISIVWSPAIGYDNAIEVTTQFPNKNPGDHFVDIIGPSSYAEVANLTSDVTATTTLCLTTTCVALAQQFSLPIAMCELGGITHAGVSAATTWIPDCVGYLKSIGMTVPIEFLCLYDGNSPYLTDPSVEWSNATLAHIDITNAWQAGFLSNGVTPINTTTTSAVQAASSGFATGTSVAVAGSTTRSQIATIAHATGTSTAAMTGSFSGSSLTAPAPAAAAGFHTLVFNDDFKSAATVTGTLSSTTIAGVNWYAANFAETAGTNYNVLTTSSAAATANGNTGGGSFASSNGGILQLLGVTAITWGDNFNTVPSSNTGPLAWKHGYFEAYIQVNSTQSSPSGYFTFQASTTTGTTAAIVNIVGFGNVNITPAASSGWSTFDPTTTRNTGGPYTVDSNWHAYGVLWKGNGTTGTLDIYFDNVHIGGPVTTGTGGTMPDLEVGTTFLNIGTGVGLPVFIDYVRVWQAP